MKCIARVHAGTGCIVYLSSLRGFGFPAFLLLLFVKGLLRFYKVETSGQARH